MKRTTLAYRTRKLYIPLRPSMDESGHMQSRIKDFADCVARTFLPAP